MGNIRLSYSDANNDGTVETSEIREEKHYYPFGLQHKVISSPIQEELKKALDLIEVQKK